MAGARGLALKRPSANSRLGVGARPTTEMLHAIDQHGRARGPKAPFSICVVGGGFSGVASAIACLTRIKTPFRLTIIDPTPVLGQGIAYGSHQALHLLNARTRDLSVRADQPGDFLNWAFGQLDQGENHADLHEALAHTFLPRQLFGEYVRQRLREAIERRPDVEFTLILGTANACVAEHGHYRVISDEFEPIIANVVILATAYGPLRSPNSGALSPFQTLVGDRIAKAGSMALIGSGLTMVDMLLAARRDGFRGDAIVISRRGQLPRAHAPRGVVPQSVSLPRFRRVSMLSVSIRIACELAQQAGTPWQALVNGLRPRLQQIWQELAIEEQARFLRHLRPLWDAHRHRLPIELHGQLMKEFNEGSAVLIRGSVIEVARKDERFRLTVVKRGSSRPEVIDTDLAFDCSGFRPDLDQPLIRNLFTQNLAFADAHRLGIVVERTGQVIGKNGKPSRGLFAIGPLCQGTLWEITAVPEIVSQADGAAINIVELRRQTKAELCC